MLARVIASCWPGLLRLAGQGHCVMLARVIAPCWKRERQPGSWLESVAVFSFHENAEIGINARIPRQPRPL